MVVVAAAVVAMAAKAAVDFRTMLSALWVLPATAGALAGWFYLSREKRQDKHRFRPDPASGTRCRNGPAAEAAAFLKDHPETVILDVRSPREYASGALRGAQLIPSGSGDFSVRISALDPAVPVLVYCAGGHRSRKAVDALKALDFKTIQHIHRGYYSWLMAGLPFEIPERS